MNTIYKSTGVEPAWNTEYSCMCKILTSVMDLIPTLMDLVQWKL